MSEINRLSDLEYTGLADTARARDAGQSPNGRTITVSTSTTPSTASNMASGTWRLIALSSPVHVRFTTTASPSPAQTTDMVVPVGVPILVRLGPSSFEQGVSYDALSVRTTTGTGTLYLSPLTR